MRSRNFLYPIVITLMFALPLTRYYISTPGRNGCVIDYVNSIESSDFKGFIYNINGQNHVEPANSNMNKALEKYRTGKINGCLMVSQDFYADLNNTFYCSVVYMIKKAPINKDLKKPFGIMKN